MTDTAVGIPQNRTVAFKEAIQLGFQNYVKFEGRSSRGAFWYWVLFAFLASLATQIIDNVIFPGSMASPLNTLTSLALLIPGIAITVRRLHDMGKSGWWYLLAFTIIGILLLIYWACQPGMRTDNQFGPDKEAGRA